MKGSCWNCCSLFTQCHPMSADVTSWGPFYKHESILIPAWMCNQSHAHIDKRDPCYLHVPFSPNEVYISCMSRMFSIKPVTEQMLRYLETNVGYPRQYINLAVLSIKCRLFRPSFIVFQRQLLFQEIRQEEVSAQSQWWPWAHQCDSRTDRNTAANIWGFGYDTSLTTTPSP